MRESRSRDAMTEIGELFLVQTFDPGTRVGTLLSDRGVVVHVRPETRLERPLASGDFVSADAGSAEGRFVATAVRDWTPPVQVTSELALLLQRYERAGFDLSIPDVPAYLSDAITTGGLGGSPAGAPRTTCSTASASSGRSTRSCGGTTTSNPASRR